MSYILDALKKSEQERGHGNTPGVQTIHSASINYHNQKKSYWPYILIAAVVLNLIAIVYFILQKNDNNQDMSPATSQTISLDQATTQADKTKTAPQATIATQPTKSVNSIKAQPTGNNSPAPDTANIEIAKPTQTNTAINETVATKQVEPTTNSATEQIVDFHDLPPSIKNQLPAIIISAHVYSSNPAQRSIVINNNFLEEGEYIIDDLVLHTITPNGAILNYQGTLFRYGAISSWQ